ncbi:MFS transporter [Streptomyces abyssomicinicus]|uniref:MFS transporter n=1 Tax=Streptomyces abyssomicinicus TaxID=574929 RepID=UPI001250C48D|nr:MFS transporter [Streptomyces abyssomicinicus]
MSDASSPPSSPSSPAASPGAIGTASPPAPGGPGDAPDPRRWWGLVVIALAQLMVVLDATIVNIAMPSAQKALDIGEGDKAWMITAYTLAFGGLLLLGGRVADLVGRKRTFVIGLVGFAVASAIGGAAQTPGMLFAARALQGVFGALLAPSALSLMTTTFTDPRERGKAFGIYGALAGAGGAVGLLLGGVLTEYLDWRWCLYVNIPIALVAVIGASVLLHDRPGHREARLDVPGVLLGCGGLVAVVYGFSEAEALGWSDSEVLALLIGGALLLAGFVLWQSRTATPLLPLRVLADRDRAGSFLTMGLATIGMFGLFLFMTYYLQGILGYSPVKTGLAFLPMSAAIMIGSTQISARLLPRTPPRLLMVPGMLLGAAGLALLTFLEVDSDYVTHVLPGMLLLGLGMGLTFMPVFSTATQGVRPQDAGVTSAMVNTSQQVGGSLGTALLNTIAASATGSYVDAHLAGGADQARVLREGMVHGFTQALWWGVAAMLLAALAAGLLVTTGPAARGHHAPAGGGH